MPTSLGPFSSAPSVVGCMATPPGKLIGCRSSGTFGSPAEFVDIDRLRNELGALASQPPPHLGDALTLSHRPTDQLDLLLTESWDDTNAGITAGAVPCDGITHFLQTNDKCPRLTVKLILSDIQVLSHHQNSLPSSCAIEQRGHKKFHRNGNWQGLSRMPVAVLLVCLSPATAARRARCFSLADSRHSLSP